MANWFEGVAQTVHERLDEVVAYLKEHGAGDIDTLVKEAVADELKGDSVNQTLADLVKTEIAKYVAGAAAVSTPVVDITKPAVVEPVAPSTPVFDSVPTTPTTGA